MPPVDAQNQQRPAQTTYYPLPDANNSVTQPTGSQNELQLSEGVYALRDELLFGSIPPHPSEIPAQNQNVLDPKPFPPTSGTRLSLAVLAPRQVLPWMQRPTSGVSGRSSTASKEAENPFRSSYSGSDPGSHPNTGSGSGGLGTSCKFGEGNPALVPAPVKESKDPLKRKKPKSNISKSGSSFVSRAMLPDGLNKRLQERRFDGVLALANLNRAILWLDLSSANKQDQLAKLLFAKGHPLCHDFNLFTKTPAHLDTVIGFSSGDIMWYEPMSQKYTRLNKNGLVHSFPISCIRWLPGSENLFIAAHHDGTLVVYDKEKEDAAVFPEENIDDSEGPANGRPKAARLIIKKSVQSKTQKHNPLCVWKVVNSRINGLEFSPDGRLLAVVSEDGSLRIVDYLKEQLLDLYSSYFGGLTCVCWSPDGKYIATGGQDDLISIISVEDRALVARCVGHRSWVSDIAFDPWKSDDRTYRIGSVGDDCRILLWDFSVGMLHRPRQASIRQSVSSYASDAVDRHRGSVATVRRISEPDRGADGRGADDIRHAIQPRAQVPMIPPVLSKEVDSHPLTWLDFEEDCILTACKGGHILTWDRPPGGRNKGGAAAALGFTNPFR